VISSKEEMGSKVKEQKEELEELILFIKELEGEWVIKNRKTDLENRRRSYKYYLDFENPLLTQIVETFSVIYLNKVLESDSCQECIVFSCKSEYPNTYWGFYYVEDDQFVGWDGLRIYYPTEKEGEGYIYPAVNISGVYYTEKIMDNWYYYITKF